MSTRRITISVPEEIAARIKKEAGAMSVSAWVARLIEKKLEEAELERQWEGFYRDVTADSRAKRRAAAIVRRVKRPDAKALDAAYKAASKERWRRTLAKEWRPTETA